MATAALLTVVTLVAFEALAVATVMPVAARALGGIGSYALAFATYFSTLLLGVVVAGGWNDARGPRAPVLAGLVVFAAGLLVAGTASTFPLLLAGRAVSGLGGGLLSVSLYVVVADVYPEALRPRVFGAISTAWVLPSIVGPAVAGWLATHASWRAVFLGVVPLALILVPVLLPRLRRTAPSEASPTGAAGTPGALARGVVLAAGALAVQVGIDVGRAGGWLLAAGGAVGVLAALPGLVPPGTLRLAPGMPSLVAVRALFTGTWSGAEAFIPLMLVAHRGLSPALAGAALTAGSLGWTTGSWLQGTERLRVERVRLLVAGAAVLGTGILLLALTPLGGVPAAFVPVAWIVTATGMGLGMSSQSVLMLQLAPTGGEGRSGAALQIGDALGAVLGIGLAGAVFASLGGARSGAGGAPYAVVWALVGVSGLLAALAARRVRPA